MKILAIGIGLAIGVIAVYINYATTKKGLKKGDAKALSAASSVHTVVDVAALGVAFLMKFVLPVNVMFFIVPTAVAASTGTLITTFILTKKLDAERKKAQENK